MLLVTSDLIQAIHQKQEAVVKAFGTTADDEFRVMVNVDGRWRDIKWLEYDKDHDVILIELGEWGQNV
jgi:glycine cleavage system aminomethyltransferase T